MDPGRQAVMGQRPRPCSPADLSAPLSDPKNRVGKPPQANRRRRNRRGGQVVETQDEQSRRYVDDEDKFVLEQSKKKADIRVRERRATPIDFLAFNIRFIDPLRDLIDEEENDVEVEVPLPAVVIRRLNSSQLDSLEKEIESYHTLEMDSRNREYWQACRTLSIDRRLKLSGQSQEGRVVSSVADDIEKILKPKTFEELDSLEAQIRGKLSSGGDIDVDYWEQLLQSLLIWKAKAKIQKMTDAARQSRIEILRKRDPGKALRMEQAHQLFATQVKSDAWRLPSNILLSSAPPDSPVASTSHNEAATISTDIVPAISAAASASSAPPPGTQRFSHTGGDDFSQATKALYEREVARGVGENEEIFAAEETVPLLMRPKWADRYRPRKPRYFNRVQMGYEWNKYNQTHYDHDNPPPRVVQGYRFNIFYPELIDKSKAPTFKIIREGGRRRGESFAESGQEDTCLIRFIAGPPYEDIAFRIVDREWDYSAKRERGFKSSFEKGILQLHFQFKRIFYRK